MYQMVLSIILVHFLLSHRQLAAATLTSSVAEDGRQAACPGDIVIFTCSVSDSPTLAWILMPYIPSWGANSIVFLPTDLGKPPVERDMNITATLTRVVRHPSNVFAANFSSILTVPAVSELNGSIVECSGSGVGLIISLRECDMSTELPNVSQDPPSGHHSDSGPSEEPPAADEGNIADQGVTADGSEFVPSQSALMTTNGILGHLSLATLIVVVITDIFL